MIYVGAGFDFLDGFAARALNVKSELGKQLDSLSDLVTFGVLPGVIVYTMAAEVASGWLIYLPFMIPIGSALRLAKFNIDTRQTDFFIGLPTPAMALVVGSLPFIISEQHVSGNFGIYTLLGISVFLSGMMVSPVKLLAFKFSHFKWKGNESRYILVLLFLILAFYFSFLAAPIVFVLYLIFSFFAKHPEIDKKA